MPLKPVAFAVVVTIAVVACAGAVQAQQVYRCESRPGYYDYSDRPCPPRARESRINVTPNAAELSPQKAAQRRQQLRANRQQDAQDRQAARHRPTDNDFAPAK